MTYTYRLRWTRTGGDVLPRSYYDLDTATDVARMAAYMAGRAVEVVDDRLAVVKSVDSGEWERILAAPVGMEPADAH